MNPVIISAIKVKNFSTTRIFKKFLASRRDNITNGYFSGIQNPGMAYRLSCYHLGNKNFGAVFAGAGLKNQNPGRCPGPPRDLSLGTLLIGDFYFWVRVVKFFVLFFGMAVNFLFCFFGFRLEWVD
jgi:hypothetical protein